jgi:WD40 repeat protein
VVLGDSAEIDVWNLETRQCEEKLTGHSLPALAVASARKADRVVTISGDRTARVWDARTSESLAVFELTSNPTAAGILPDGSRIVTGSKDGSIRAFTIGGSSTGHLIGTHNGSVSALAIAVNGDSVVSAGDDQVLCWWSLSKEE